MCFYLSFSKTVLNKHLRTLYFVIIYLLEINKCHNYDPNDITCQVLVNVWRSKVEHTNIVSVVSVFIGQWQVVGCRSDVFCADVPTSVETI